MLSATHYTKHQGKPVSPKFRVSRRSLLQSCGVLAASGFSSNALAQQAFQPRAPAHHRFLLGSRDILVLNDGHLVIPTAMLAGNIPQAEAESFLAIRSVDTERVHFHINVALVKTGNDYVLIDAGSGGTWESTAGKLADSLDAADIKPEQIGTVVLTHAHPDHIWGLIDELDDSLRFPRAQYVVAAREFDFWTSGKAAKLTGPIEGIAAGARRVFKRIEFARSASGPVMKSRPGSSPSTPLATHQAISRC